MPNPLTPERLEELRAELFASIHPQWFDIDPDELEALLDAAEERVALREESIAAWATGGACARALGDDVKPSEAPERIRELIAERDSLRVELDEMRSFASKSELAMAEDWRLATTAASALKQDRDRLKTALDQTRALWQAETKVSAEWCGKATAAQKDVDRLRERVRVLESSNEVHLAELRRLRTHGQPFSICAFTCSSCRHGDLPPGPGGLQEPCSACHFRNHGSGMSHWEPFEQRIRQALTERVRELEAERLTMQDVEHHIVDAIELGAVDYRNFEWQPVNDGLRRLRELVARQAAALVDGEATEMDTAR